MAAKTQLISLHKWRILTGFSRMHHSYSNIGGSGNGPNSFWQVEDYYSRNRRSFEDSNQIPPRYINQLGRVRIFLWLNVIYNFIPCDLSNSLYCWTKRLAYIILSRSASSAYVMLDYSWPKCLCSKQVWWLVSYSSMKLPSDSRTSWIDWCWLIHEKSSLLKQFRHILWHL